MGRFMHEPRTAVMIVALASWQETNGVVETVPARIEDRSSGGACIRLKKPVVVGSKLKVETHREHFFGVSKYCRTDGMDFLVGIQRDKTINSVMSLPASLVQEAPPSEDAKPVLLLNVKVEDHPVETTLAPAAATPAMLSVPGVAVEPAAAQAKEIKVEIFRVSPEPDRPPDFLEAPQGRKTMRNKLLELAHWRSKPSVVVEDENESGENGNRNQSAPDGEIAELHSTPVGANLKIELLPVDEIYRAAGITSVRNGASITRVVEMLRSEHIRSLSSEMKRAAILMALDTAGIPLPQVLQDAIARQKALDSYEADLKHMVEAGWARKTEENAQIEAELERVKSHYTALIARNLESIEREKATFAAWLGKKQEESQNIGEASALLSKPEADAPRPAPSAQAEQAKAASAN